MAQYTKQQALLALFPDAKWSWIGSDYSEISWDASNTDSKPTEQQITDKLSAMETEYTNNQYQRTRQGAYPSLGEQMDMQYWDSVNGTTTWKDAIAKVKRDNPKPS